MFYPLPFISIVKYFFEPDRINLSLADILSQQHVHAITHTHTHLFPSACGCLPCLEAVSELTAKVRRMCRCATADPLQTALACVCVGCVRALVFVPFCVYVQRTSVNQLVVCVCVCARTHLRAASHADI